MLVEWSREEIEGMTMAELLKALYSVALRLGELIDPTAARSLREDSEPL